MPCDSVAFPPLPGQFSEQEKMYNYPKVAYPMFSRPRGIGLIINNKNFTCGMKVGGVSFVTWM